RRMFRAALEEGIAGGPPGYPADTVLAMSPWNLDLDRIAVPVSIHYGAHDRAHSPDHCRTLASRIPAARLHTDPHAGGSLLWARPGRIRDDALHPGGGPRGERHRGDGAARTPGGQRPPGKPPDGPPRPLHDCPQGP